MARPSKTHPDSSSFSSVREVMVENLAVLTFAFSPGGGLLDWNQRLAAATGYSQEELEYLSPQQLIRESDRQPLDEAVEQALTAGESVCDVHLVPANGSTVSLELRVSAASFNGRRIICCEGRKRAGQEENAGRRERQYRRLFEESREAITIVTRAGKIIEANPAACDLFGYSRKEILALDLPALCALPDDRATLRHVLETEGAVQNRELHLRHRSGEERICQASITPHFRADGAVESYQAFFRDVTEQKRAIDALRESEEKFRALAENNLVGIALIQEGVFKYLNPTYAHMFGYSQDELLDAPIRPLIYPDDREMVRRKLQLRVDGKENHAHYVFRGQTKHGEVRYIEVHGGRVTYEGKPAVLGTLLDITERRRMQREILHIQEQERQRIGQDLHDAVGSSLSGTTMILRALANKARRKFPELGEEVDQVRAMVRKSSDDVRRMSRGMNPINLDGEGLLAGLERLIQNSHPEEGLALNVDDTCGDLSLLHDEISTHLYWITQEAVTNARKYANADHIVVELTCQKTELVLTVTDDGTGFEQSTAEQEGMGLRTMRYRAELLGGTMSIESSSGKGTTVRCRFPVDEFIG